MLYPTNNHQGAIPKLVALVWGRLLALLYSVTVFLYGLQGNHVNLKRASANGIYYRCPNWNGSGPVRRAFPSLIPWRGRAEIIPTTVWPVWHNPKVSQRLSTNVCTFINMTKYSVQCRSIFICHCTRCRSHKRLGFFPESFTGTN